MPDWVAMTLIVLVLALLIVLGTVVVLLTVGQALHGGIGPGACHVMTCEYRERPRGTSPGAVSASVLTSPALCLAGGLRRRPRYW